MCWLARVRVVAVADKRLTSRLSVPAGVFGEPPDLWVGPMCACGLVKEQGHDVAGRITDVVEELVDQSAVKRVEVMWWWGNDEPSDPPEERLSIGEFSRRAGGSVAPETLYRVNDPARWGRGWVREGA